MLYLDNASTTKIHSDVLKAMMPYLTDVFGNPNSMYYKIALDSKSAIENARKHVGDLFGTKPESVIFTSGAGESNNTIIKGIAEKNPGCHFITSNTEHSTILETFRYLETKGFKVTYLPVNEIGKVNTLDLINTICDHTKLVSIMWANNEVGTLNNIRELSRICKEKKVLFHTDATQAIGKIDCNLGDYPDIDFLSISAHKIYGPKGVGCLLIRSLDLSNLPFVPLIHGGDQEKGLRGSTLATHQIVGFGEAAKICKVNLINNISILLNQEKILVERLRSIYGNRIEIINNFEDKIPGLLSVRFIGINNQILLRSIANDIAASAGAACSNTKPSHVLLSMGFKIDVISQIIRLSLSPYDEYHGFNEFN